MSSILWATWKDSAHPEAGGAEVVCREIATRLLADGHQLTMLTCGYDGATKQEVMHGGVNVIRVGKTRYAHPFQALMYYLRHLRNSFDILVEEVNGAAPYFCVLFERKAKRFLLYHQLARKNWLYEIPKPFAQFGYYALAPGASRIVSMSRAPVITVSESTRRVLTSHGFSEQEIHIISEGIQIAPISHPAYLRKYRRPTLLSLGSMRAMKRTLDQVKAFELAKPLIPNLQLNIAGSASSAYGQSVLSYIDQSEYKNDIHYFGRVCSKEKISLMQQSHLILQTAVEEGWGLTITEAASQGTPAVAYNVDGLRDSIRHEQTGIITREEPISLSLGILAALTDKSLYKQLQESAWEWSKQITFDQCYQDFKQVVGIA